MSNEPVLTIHAVPHRNPQVRQVGVGLDDPYVEQCWTPILGPSSVLLLRRMPLLWQHADPTEIPMTELSRSIGLGTGISANSPMQHTLDRLERYGFCRQSPGGHVAVPTTAGPLSLRQLERVPAWCQQQHEDLWGRHLDALAAGEPPPGLDLGRAITPEPSQIPTSTAPALPGR